MPVDGENERISMVHRQATELIWEWLVATFDDVTGGDSQTLFVFRARFGDRAERWQLKFSREFVEHPHHIKRLPAYMQLEILPALLSNPGKQIHVGPNGEITVL
jgi:hypothetical protein